MALLIAAIGIPLTTVTAGLRGILEALEDFKIINLLRIVLGMANFGLPALSVMLISDSLVWMVASLILARAVVLMMHTWFVHRKATNDWISAPVSKRDVRSLFSFGAWMSVSNVISPLMVTADRFLLSALLGAAAVAYYTVPFEALSRVLVIPAALSAALFPRLATVMASDLPAAEKLYIKSIKTVLTVLLPICLLLAFGSRLGLSVWLGDEFAERSWMIVCVMASGILFNGLASIPYALVQAAGNARATAILHALEFALYLPLLFFSVKTIGILGAPFAWSVRTLVDMILLMTLSRRYFGATKRDTVSAKALS
jgi:O-antigen/teichoic acid export membrane protein